MKTKDILIKSPNLTVKKNLRATHAEPFLKAVVAHAHTSLIHAFSASLQTASAAEQSPL